MLYMEFNIVSQYGILHARHVSGLCTAHTPHLGRFTDLNEDGEDDEDTLDEWLHSVFDNTCICMSLGGYHIRLLSFFFIYSPFKNLSSDIFL